MSNITVRIKTEETTLKEEFLIYDPYAMSYDDPVLCGLVETTLKKYSGELLNPDITIGIKITWVHNGL